MMFNHQINAEDGTEQEGKIMRTIKIEALPDGTHRRAGTFDKAGRWYPDAEYQINGTFAVRSPSRTWPYSYLKHFYTAKYARALATQAPRQYMQAAGIDEQSEQGKMIIAAYAAQKMQ